MKVPTVNTSGKKGKEVESSLFDRAGSATLVSQAVRVYLANQRAATAKTKTRAEVNLTKKKWFKQKGTGNARHGAQSAPIFVGGGVAHGPRGNGNWKLSMSQTMRSRALETCLSLQAKAEKVLILEGVESLTGKTAQVASLLRALELQTKAVLLVTDTTNELVLRATQNVGNVLVCSSKDLNTYVVARAQSILITPEGLQALEQRLGGSSAQLTDSSKKTEAKVKKSVAKKKKLSTEN